jgi:predicted nucleic acid-binding protein
VRIFLDTNVLLRNVVQSDPQYLQVNAALDRLVRGGWELCIGTQNVVEFWVVATRPVDVNGLGLTPEQTQQEVAVLMATYTILRDPPDILERWLDLCIRYSVSGRPTHDARIVALMLSDSVTHLLTLNTTDFIRYREITCVTPETVPEPPLPPEDGQGPVSPPVEQA